VTKIVVDADKFRALCVTRKGTNIVFDIPLKDNEELKRLSDDYAIKVLDVLEKEIG
jgi:hypothetical protein